LNFKLWLFAFSFKFSKAGGKCKTKLVDFSTEVVYFSEIKVGFGYEFLMSMQKTQFEYCFTTVNKAGERLPTNTVMVVLQERDEVYLETI